MKVRMKMKIEGTRNGVRWPAAGEVVDLPEGEARDLLSQGVADEVKAEPKVEKPAPETATAPKPATRKK